MIRAIPKSIDRSSVLHYMGADGWKPDARSAVMLDRAEEMLRNTATPRAVWRQLPRTALASEQQGNDLERHLDGCDQVILLAATLGSRVDAMLRRLELTDIALAATADAMASVLLERVCEEQEEDLRACLEQQGCFLTGRFAPGYGDCPLEWNDMICLATDSVRGAGIAVTAQHLLAPRKSTTAILGIADHPVTGTMAGCATCHVRETCDFRKRGTTCFIKK